jgi:hypothetical protein
MTDMVEQMNKNYITWQELKDRPRPKGFRGYNSFKYWLRAKVRNVWEFFRYDIHQGVGSLIAWWPLIWNDRDWDHAYLLDILALKLRRMSDLQRDYGNGVNHMRYSRQLLVCSVLCKRIRDDNYYEEAEKAFGKSRDKNGHHWYITMAMANQKHEQELLGKMIGKYISYWWD